MNLSGGAASYVRAADDFGEALMWLLHYKLMVQTMFEIPVSANPRFSRSLTSHFLIVHCRMGVQREVNLDPHA